ncbi:1-acyl-sn-glycerol-3-phosphate acyltransferase [Haloferula helveola]|uniref:1-acyl-sn-glycerol-3-phosphate acyltransferase n=1 Tax=Haloferula helveola TaxID=490095 RepID=A0ABM7RAY1_9BACT|nr:1-acyl-sn-glycerol-3-phosphate acyltransferase [Haloferula helveola]
MKSASLSFLTRLATGVRLASDLPVPAAPRLYFANHSSHLDFVVIWSALPKLLRARTRPVAAAEYWEGDALRRCLADRVFNAVLIPRNPARMRKENPVELMHEAVANDADLILFPEGTRSRSGHVAPFKPGFYHLASRHPEIELVPVYLENLNRILPKGEHVPIPLMGRVEFGEPIAGPAPGEDKSDFLQRSRMAVIELSRGNLTISPDEGS